MLLVRILMSRLLAAKLPAELMVPWQRLADMRHWLDEAGFCGRAIHGGLMVQLNPELRGIVALSLGVSLTASICAFVIGSLFGAALATRVT
jgi:hypothetical protein